MSFLKHFRGGHHGGHHGHAGWPNETLTSTQPQTVVACARCATRNSEDARFCSGCGNALLPSCPACQAPLVANAKFCGKCGQSLSE